MNDQKITEKISQQEASRLLGVSPATVRNWVKSGSLKISNKTELELSEVLDLKENLENGQKTRLSSRANKRNSDLVFIPEEYISTEDMVDVLHRVLEVVNDNQYDMDATLIAITLRLLEGADLITVAVSGTGVDILEGRKHILEEISVWKKETDSKQILQCYSQIGEIILPNDSDFLGLVLQSIKTEGDKAQTGSYYTPKKLVDEIVNETVRENDLVLDPCCGTGQFLISASKIVRNPEHVWGFDIDEHAVRIARINLILMYPNDLFTPNIFRKNTLMDLDSANLFSQTDTPKFDSVVTNPPWGAHFTAKEKKELKRIFPEIKSGEAFSYFIKKGYDMLKDKGRLSFVLPESILNIKTHRDVRSILIKNTTIQKIQHLDRIFKNVFTPVLRVDITKEKPEPDHKIISRAGENTYENRQSDYLNTNDHILNVFRDKNDVQIFKKVYKKKHLNLRGNADWALGIVTGNNKRYVLQNSNDGLEPILTGKDIKRYRAKHASNYIQFTPSNFQQVAPTHKYRSEEKLLYKFISKQLVFAYDDGQTLTLNSANVLLPRIEYPIKTILALFNSSPYQFIYQKKFGAIKALRKDIEDLPLPLLDESDHKEIEKMILPLLDHEVSTEERKEMHQRLDNHIMQILGLNKSERDYVLESVKNSDKLLELM